MSYFIVYGLDESGEKTEDGDDLASGTGWHSFGNRVLEEAEEFPEVGHLCQEGWLPAEALDDAIHELETLTHDRDPNTAAVAGRLMGALANRPEGTTSVLITDGTADDEDGDDDEADSAEE